MEQSLDVAVDIFSMIGGEERFMESCGAGNKSEREGSVFSKQTRKTLEAHNNISKVSEHLKRLEGMIIHDIMKGQEKNDLFSDLVTNSRQTLEELDQKLISSIIRHLLSKNSSERGLILWLNPGVSRDIQPVPIYLRETIQFLLRNKDFDSTGRDIFDVLGESNSAVQYGMIKEALRQSKEINAADFVTESTEKCLDTQGILKLKALYFDENEFDVTEPNAKVIKKTEALMLEIVQSAKKIMQDILSQRVYATDRQGIVLGFYIFTVVKYLYKYVNFLYVYFTNVDFDYTSSCQLNQAEVIFYYTRTALKGLYYYLYKEFEKELTGSYSVLPLVRPTKLNATHCMHLDQEKANATNVIHGISSALLKGFAEHGENQEIVARDGCGRANVTAEGDRVLYNPDAHKYAISQVEALLASKPKKAAGSTNFRELQTKTIKELKIIAIEDQISLTGCKKKSDFVDRITDERKKRARLLEEENVVDEEDDDEEDDAADLC